MAPCLIEENRGGPSLHRDMAPRQIEKNGRLPVHQDVGSRQLEEHRHPNPPVKQEAKKAVKAMTFYPTFEEFKDLRRLVIKI